MNPQVFFYIFLHKEQGIIYTDTAGFTVQYRFGIILFITLD